MAGTPTPETSLQAIDAQRSNLLSFIAHCQSSLATPTIVRRAADVPAPLNVLHDAATLTKAHVTRLSIALRPPITSDAAAKFLQELATTVVPAFVAGTEALIPEAYGKALRTECIEAVKEVLKAIEQFVRQIEMVAGDAGGDRLLNTGMVWSAADRLIAVRERGLAGVVCQCVQSQADVFSDAVEELKEWLENIDGDQDEENDDDNDAPDDEQQFWDSSKAKLAKDDVQTKKRVEDSLKTMKLVSILFNAAKKRRLGNTAEGKIVNRVQALDRIADVSKELAELGDNLAMGYYDGEIDEAIEAETSLVNKAVELADLLAVGNNGKSDTFSKWFDNCKEALSERL